MNENYKMDMDEQEIDLVQMVMAVLRKWRGILVGMVLVALVLAAYKGMMGFRALNDTEAVATANTIYEHLVENNKEAQKASRVKMQDLNRQIIEQSTYINESSYMDIDPYNVHVGAADYYIKTDYEILPGMSVQNKDYTSSIVSAYVRFVMDESNLQTIADATNMKTRYLKELISVYNAGDGILSIRVIADRPELTTQILELLNASVYANTDMIAKTVDDHDISLMNQSIYDEVDNTIEAHQIATKDNLTATRTAYSKEQEEYEKLKEAASEIENPGYDMKSIIKSVIKFGILGAIVGAFLVAGVVAVQYLMGDEIYSGSEMESRLGLRNLGGVCKSTTNKKGKSKKELKVDLDIAAKQSRVTSQDGTVGYQLAANRLAGLVAAGSNVLVTGEAAAEEIAEVVKYLAENAKELSFTEAGSLLKDADALKKCGQCDVVLLVEQVGQSKYSRIRRELDIATEQGKKVAGAFVVE